MPCVIFPSMRTLPTFCSAPMALTSQVSARLGGMEVDVVAGGAVVVGGSGGGRPIQGGEEEGGDGARRWRRAAGSGPGSACSGPPA